ncbi:MAG: hypothetical protein EXR74_07295 [Bdellovibrionales bacterium]|nr:hypothetical protein [Bdellovibrionales bacterium]
MRLVSAVGLLLFIPGCAWFGTKSAPPEEMGVAPKVGHRYEISKAAKREPGSLWSEDSRWNSIYNASGGRLVGDTISIKVNEPFKDRISMAMNQNRRPEATKTATDPKADSKADPKAESREPASASQATAKKEDTALVEATILEVLPNGSYRVGVNRAFKVGREQPYVVMEAIIKEKEIGSDDSASSDALMNLKLETFDEQKHSIKNEKFIAPENSDAKKS